MSITIETKKEIVARITKVLARYCPPMVITSKSDDEIQLIGNKEMLYGSKK